MRLESKHYLAFRPIRALMHHVCASGIIVHNIGAESGAWVK